jgi:hypothetical protein
VLESGDRVPATRLKLSRARAKFFASGAARGETQNTSATLMPKSQPKFISSGAEKFHHRWELKANISKIQDFSDPEGWNSMINDVRGMC